MDHAQNRVATLKGFTLKAAGDQWSFVGTASTPTLDRVNDSVDPLGARFKLPLPLLLQHAADKPVGHIVSATVDKSGIRVEGKITEPTADMPPGMVGRLREAWTSIKSGLIRGLSIGFNPIEYAPNDKGGFDIAKWDWLELSIVTVPAQPEAGISSFKAFQPPAVHPHGGFPLRPSFIKLR
jgi:HK97 family phage prohead protease